MQLRRSLLAFFVCCSTIRIGAQTQTPYTSAIPIPGTLQAEEYDRGGNNVAWFDTTAGNVFGAFRSDDMDVGAIPAGGHHIGFLTDGEWAEYTVSTAATDTYNVTLRWASAYTGATSFRLLQDGVALTTQTVTSTGDWQTYATRTFQVNLAAGTHVLRVEFTQGSWNFDSLVFARQTPYNPYPIAIPGPLQAEEYDRGGNDLAWRDLTPGNVFGVFRSDDMDVGAISSGGYHIGYLTDGEWAEYTVSIATTATYNVTLRWASAYTGATSFRILSDGVLLTTQTVTSTGDWQSYATRTFPVSLNAGTHILRVDFTQGSWNFDSLVFAQQTTCTMPSITVASQLVEIDDGTSYTLAPTVSGATSYQWLKNGGFIIGAVSSTLPLTNVEEGTHAGSYALKATNSCGTTTSLPIDVKAKCASVANNVYNIYRILNSEGLKCDFAKTMEGDFPILGTDRGNSYNWPVVSAAVAYLRNDPRWDNVNWWRLYLRGELGERGTEWYYGGQEFGSNEYHYFNIISVMAVYYEATRTGNTEIAGLAQRWLRATFAMHAIAAGPNFPVRKYADLDPSASDVPLQSRSMCAGAPPNCAKYNGSYVAMAGDRTFSHQWTNVHRNIYFTRAVELPGNQSGEDAPFMRPTRQRLESLWQTRTGNARDAYGLTADERQDLRESVNTCGKPNMSLVDHYLGTALRTKKPYHFVNWQSPERVRATLTERSTHRWPTPATMGMVYFMDRDPAQTHFLYPWNAAFGTTSSQGLTLANGILDLANRTMIATNEASPGTTHGPWHVKLDLPGGQPCYHVTLSDTAAPFVHPPPPGAPSMALPNLAFGKLTMQSSSYLGATSALAVDGNTNGNYFNNSVTHTYFDANAWWQVDLGSVSSIDTIRVWNRTDCCPERLSNFYVFVSDVPFSSTALSTTLSQPGVWNFYVASSAGTPSTIAVNRSGRYVRVQLAGTNYLSIAEVQVLGWPGPPPPNTIWVEDETPAGAVLAGSNETWTWIDDSVSPGPYSGSFSHQSSLYGDVHQHFFDSATETLAVQTGDVLFAYVYLDPLNPPSQVMLQWNDGTWEHRAYWGANQIGWGADGTISRRFMGTLPPTGQWVKLLVPASAVGLEGRTVKGMAFTLYGGRATWDRAGKY